MIDWTKPVRYIPDLKAPCRVICTDKKGSAHSVLVLVDVNMWEVILGCMVDGTQHSSGKPVFENIPERMEVERYIGVFDGCQHTFGPLSKRSLIKGFKGTIKLSYSIEENKIVDPKVEVFNDF